MLLPIYSAYMSLITHRVYIHSLAPNHTFLPSLDLVLWPAKTNDSSWSSPPNCPGAPPYGIPHFSSLGGTSSCSPVVRSVCYDSTIDIIADSSRKRKRRSGKDDDCSDDDDNFAPASAAPTASDRHLSRRGKIRRQRLEMEQSRRDELRDSYLRLKDALPVSNTTPKALLLDRATDHIKSLELRVQQAENEAARLHQCVHFSSPSIAVLTLFFKAQ